ncbi:formiminoglutamase [Chitinophaga costaii]|uniref:Formimidoylglutamase n=1 Tax=Chitinophaga costaii TaxID=1335309 RepID=A0A1C3Z6L4_9BACT|nr:formimidoylglutamase [Chitinophaga costaii]PUZ30252.1 formimidoylglutamase [Chitinophaga costaii]SCB78021.1 formiminoglutamase [Chitinophaga costaii]
MKHYHPPIAWTGRTDGFSAPFLRWHQVIQPIDLRQQSLPKLAAGQLGIALLGFACDEGVRRNKGRVGAAQGPQAIRTACANFPVHFSNAHCLLDVGNITCEDNDLEGAQAALALTVAALLHAGFQPLLLGGGHEITYGHAAGIHQYLANRQTLGIINFDAHFDIRKPDDAGPSSGTGFWQLATESYVLQRPFHYLALGIQPMGNTKALFHTAAEYGVQYVPADAFHFSDTELTLSTLRNFIQLTDRIYFTTCLDVFCAAHAPGVSAPAYNGILPTGLALQCYREILHSGKVISTDIAELNPVYDSDARTARLAAALVFEIVAALLSVEY